MITVKLLFEQIDPITSKSKSLTMKHLCVNSILILVCEKEVGKSPLTWYFLTFLLVLKPLLVSSVIFSVTLVTYLLLLHLRVTLVTP
jgi:hypothetical protein